MLSLKLAIVVYVCNLGRPRQGDRVFETSLGKEQKGER